MTESLLHWLELYSHYHVHKLQMTTTSSDLCLLFQGGKNTTDCTIGVQVADNICVSTSLFCNEEIMGSNEFSEKRNVPVMETAVKFNGVYLSKASRRLRYINESEKLYKKEI